MRKISRGFPPIARADARVLVLGSLPGRMSLEKLQYYGQPRNAFWPIMGALVGAAPELDYPARVGAIERAGIALWDVLAAAERPGSLDSAIVTSTMQVNDFAGLFSRCRRIEAVFFNGRKAAELYGRRVVPALPPGAAGLPVVTLPSTSPAHAGMRLVDKQRRWREALSPYLR